MSRYIKSIGKGILKVMSKMGISTYQSYCGAQIFDAVGLKSDFVQKYFTGTATMIEGVGLEEIAAETVSRHADAFGDDPVLRNALEVGGDYLYRMRGEAHMWSPDAVATLQHAVRKGSWETFKQFSAEIDNETTQAKTIRGLFRIRKAGADGPQAGAARQGHAGCRHRQALLDRRHVVRLDQPRGAFDAGARHEPDRRQVEHRRGRRGAGPLSAAARRRRRTPSARRSSRSRRAASA